MKYMNDSDIQIAEQRHSNHPVLHRAVEFLKAFRNEVNEHSDGWAYWKAPVQAAAKLMYLVESNDATVSQYKAALTPIKSFYTRRGNAAGMKYPEFVQEDSVIDEGCVCGHYLSEHKSRKRCHDCQCDAFRFSRFILAND